MNSRCKLGKMLGNAFSDEQLVVWITGDQRKEIKEMFGERKQLKTEVEKLSRDLDIALMLSQSREGEGLVPRNEYDRLRKEYKDVRAIVDHNRVETERKEREYAEKEKQLLQEARHQQKEINRKEALLKAACKEVKKLRAGDGKTPGTRESPVYIHSKGDQFSGATNEVSLKPEGGGTLACDHPLPGKKSDDSVADSVDATSVDGEGGLSSENIGKVIQIDASVHESTPSKPNPTSSTIGPQKVPFDQQPKPIIEDVDEYVESLEAQRQISGTREWDVAGDNTSLKGEKATIAQLELRVDELSSAKNDLKAQRDEAADRSKLLKAFISSLDPGRSRASMRKEINVLREKLERARTKTEIECDAKNRAEDRVEGLKADLVQVEKKHLQEMKNEKKLRTAAKERLVEQLNIQHELEIEDINVVHENHVEELNLQRETDRIDLGDYWQITVSDYRVLATELFHRLKYVETSLVDQKYPIC